MHEELRNAVARLARTPELLVVSDFDGTMSPLVKDPGAARAHGPSMSALEGLAALSRTHAAILSGRALGELSRLSGAPRGVRLVGSHGAETGEPGGEHGATSEQAALLERLGRALDDLAAKGPGLLVERKPLAVALHWRAASDAVAAAAERSVREGPGRMPGVHVRSGSKVLELCVTGADKGGALRAMRSRASATGVCFIGDDVTDEDAFGVLGPEDLGIKVGPGRTRAAARVPDVEAVGVVLQRLLAERRTHVGGTGDRGG
ncbi:MAG: trehalose-phosphatase [Phycisphaerales bacterium]